MIFIKKIKTVGLLIMMLWTCQVMSQGGGNPFELQHRIDEKAKLSGLSDVVEEAPINTTNQNPFEVIKSALNENSVIASATIKNEKVKTTSQQPIKKGNDNFLFLLTLTIFASLTLIATLYRSNLIKAYRAFANENVMRMLHREKGTSSYFPYYILYLFFVFNAGVFLYLMLRYYDVMSHISNLNLLLYTTGGVALALFLKHTVIRMMGMIFPLQKEASMYNMTITIFGVVLGAFLIVSNIVVAYAQPPIIPFFIYFTWAIIGAIYLFRMIRGLSISTKFLNGNFFHFFIYLCTVEIAPVLILWKIIESGAGVVQ